MSDKDEKVAQLTSMLGGGCDADTCREILEINNWNVEVCLDQLLGVSHVADTPPPRHVIPPPQDDFNPGGMFAQGLDDFTQDAFANMLQATAPFGHHMPHTHESAPTHPPPNSRPGQNNRPPPPNSRRNNNNSSSHRPTTAALRLHFTVMYLDNTHSFETSSDSTVGALKQQIESVTNVPVEKQTLLNWLTGADDGSHQLLSNLVASHGGSKNDAVALMLLCDDVETPETPIDVAIQEVESIPVDPNPIYLADELEDGDYDDESGSDDSLSRTTSSVLDDYLEDAPTRSPPKVSGLVPVGSNHPAAFSDAFRCRYGNEDSSSVPVFVVGTLRDALREGARQVKPVIVYLHSDSSMETNIFCSEVLASEDVRTFLNEHFVLWGWDMTTPVSQQALYRAEESAVLNHFSDVYPGLTVLCKDGSSVTKIDELVGYNDIAEVLTFLLLAMERAAPVLQTLRETAQKQAESERMRTERDDAYQQSLMLDRMKSQERKEAAQLETEKRLQEEEIALVAEHEQQTIESQKENARLIAENNVADEPPDDVAEVVKIQFRLPSGNRLERRFGEENTLQQVVDFVHKEGFSPDEFNVCTQRPRKVLNEQPDETTTTLKEFGFAKRDVVIVEEK
eukprot:m.157359 g.157359  ORF g.157359 m.157359 type:complete len:623 (-) comp31052_c3_seq3:79-1947(-)